MNKVFFLSFISFLISLALINRLIPILKNNLIDIPNHRSSHKTPIPRGGGIIFVLTGSILCILLNNFIPLICIPLAIVGFIDDFKNLPSKIRYLAQIITIYLLIYISVPFLNPLISNNFYTISMIIFFIFCGTAIINFINFMDGIDGLVISCMLIVFSTIAITSSPNLWPLIASMVAFLLFNWHPAKLFMGDVGSTFIGSVYAGLLFETNSLTQAIAYILIATPLLADAAFCVIRRYLYGQNIFSAHRLHLYQRLHQAGISQSKVSSLYSFSTLLLCVMFYMQSLSLVFITSTIIIAIGFYLDIKIAEPFRNDYPHDSIKK